MLPSAYLPSTEYVIINRIQCKIYYYKFYKVGKLQMFKVRQNPWILKSSLKVDFTVEELESISKIQNSKIQKLLPNSSSIVRFSSEIKFSSNLLFLV